MPYMRRGIFLRPAQIVGLLRQRMPKCGMATITRRTMGATAQEI
jgi:hypothetical protein